MLGTKLNQVKKIDEDLYVIIETESVNCYLLIGKERALLIDCGYGYEDIHPIISSITDKPVSLAVTHGDPDHALGAMHFDQVMIHPLDYGKLLFNDNSDVKGKMLDHRINKMPEVKNIIDYDKYVIHSTVRDAVPVFLSDGQMIDLGGKQIKVFHTPGHSYGHVMYLDMEKGRLFTGDQLTKHNIWFFMSPDLQAPFYTTLNSLKKLNGHRDEIKELYPAHDEFPCGLELLDDLIECFEQELGKNYLQDTPFHHSMGDGYQHFYKTVNLIYSDKRLSEFLGKKIVR